MDISSTLLLMGVPRYTDLDRATFDQPSEDLAILQLLIKTFFIRRTRMKGTKVQGTKAARVQGTASDSASGELGLEASAITLQLCICDILLLQVFQAEISSNICTRWSIITQNNSIRITFDDYITA